MAMNTRTAVGGWGDSSDLSGKHSARKAVNRQLYGLLEANKRDAACRNAGLTFQPIELDDSQQFGVRWNSLAQFHRTRSNNTTEFGSHFCVGERSFPVRDSACFDLS